MKKFYFKDYRTIFVISLILLILFLAGCSEAQKNAEQEEITGSAVEESEACRFADPKDCSPIEIVRGEEEQSSPELAAESNGTEEKPENTTIQNLVKLSLACKPGWECIERKYIGYHEANCSWHSLEKCIYGCSENISVCTGAPICKINTLKCENDNLMICGENGYRWLLNKSCDKDCENNICTEDLPMNTALNVTTNVTTNTSNNTTQNDFIADGCISVITFNYAPAGNNLSQEYFTLKNSCSYSIDMTSWTAGDNVNNPYIFPSFNLASNVEVSVVTGSGSNNQTTLYWGRGLAVWNNDEDTLYLNVSNGTSLLIYTYP